MSDLYEADIVLWSERQAELLRRRAGGELVNDAEMDWPNIAEEIEALGRSDRRELRSRISTILLYLMKLNASPATAPRAGWRDTLFEQRACIRAILRDSPSLGRTVMTVVGEELASAKLRALTGLRDHNEQAAVDLAGIHCTEDQVLGDWFPN